MTYLYGDSSPSSIEINYIDLLGQALDCCVKILLAEERIHAEGTRRVAFERRASAEVRRLEEIGAGVRLLLEPIPRTPDDTPSARCADAIRSAADEAVRAEIEHVREAFNRRCEQLEGAQSHERDTCARALGDLLASFDLPDASNEVRLIIEASGGYEARLVGTTPYGAATVVSLQIPPDNLFGKHVRVNRFVDEIEIELPETTGWIRKELRMVPHKLGKLYVSRLSISKAATVVELRTSLDHTGPSYEVRIDRLQQSVELFEINRDEGDSLVQLPVDAEKLAPLLALGEALASAAVSELMPCRHVLQEVSIDGMSLTEHTQPSVLVDRMIAAMAPVVHEISRHSRSDTELVLRRQLGHHRREEIFIPKRDLAFKLAPLPVPLREKFTILGLGDVEVDSAEPGVEPAAEPLMPPPLSPPPERDIAANAGEGRAPGSNEEVTFVPGTPVETTDPGSSPMQEARVSAGELDASAAPDGSKADPS